MYQVITPTNEGEWIEPQMYWRGQYPPISGEGQDAWIKIPHEHYIPVSKARLINALRSLYQANNEVEFETILKLVDGIYHVNFLNMHNRISQDYEYFNPRLESTLHEAVSPQEYKQRELEFLIEFARIMQTGNFLPLTERQFQDAQDLFYLFDLPIGVNIDLFETSLLKNLKSNVRDQFSQEGQAEEGDRLVKVLSQPAAIDGKLLVYTRGITHHSTKALFFFAKFNQLCKRLLLALTGKQLTRQIHQDETIESVESVIFESRWLRRISLENLDIKLSDLFKKTTLQEPMFREVVILFRRSIKRDGVSLNDIPILGELFKREEPEFGKEICVKFFKNIPIADLNIIFPEKAFTFKASDKIILFITTMIAVMSALFSFFIAQEQGKIWAIMIASILISVRTFMKFLRNRTKYMAQMSTDMYHKNFNSDECVLQYLLHAIEDQEFKEALLAYSILERSQREMTAEELDGEVERFIHDQFERVEVDFEVDDALSMVSFPEDLTPKQARFERRDQPSFLPLITYREVDQRRLYIAKPLDEAIELLSDRWMRALILDRPVSSSEASSDHGNILIHQTGNLPTVPSDPARARPMIKTPQTPSATGRERVVRTPSVQLKGGSLTSTETPTPKAPWLK